MTGSSEDRRRAWVPRPDRRGGTGHRSETESNPTTGSSPRSDPRPDGTRDRTVGPVEPRGAGPRPSPEP